jgi:hypothetical protein
MRIAALTSLTLLLGAGFVAAQDEAARKMKLEAAARVPLEMPIKGAPYSADTLVDSQQTLADGNRIARKTTGRVYRDSDGRTRREEDGPNGHVSITIVDPVAGFSYALDPENKVAWRTPSGTAVGIMQKMQAAEAAEEKRKAEEQQVLAMKVQKDAGTLTEADKEKLARAGGAPPAGEVVVRMRSGDVGIAYMPEAGPIEHKVIDGIAADGRKATTTIPAGRIGNEQPLTITSEEWRSPELNVLVLTRHSDPRTGESSYRLTNIVRAEPDRSLFLVPPDYTVRDTGIRKVVEAPRR